MLHNLVACVRNSLRLNSRLSVLAYIIQNQIARFNGVLRNLRHDSKAPARAVALCLRFRNEAPYLEEWIEYHQAAGVKHFFLYNNNSDDAFQERIQPYISNGLVTLIEWPHIPASPAAEHDCIRRTIGRYEWVGFVDADEFVVVVDGRSIPDFLADYAGAVGVAFHWYFFGSNGHIKRPNMPVLRAYTRRRHTPDAHVKLFVRPECVTQCNNSHSWFFRFGQTAVDVLHKPVRGSRSENLNSSLAYINHYYTKSAEDYSLKMRQRSTLDHMGINFPSRRIESMRHHLEDNNQVECFSALEYLAKRKAVSQSVEESG